MKMFLTRLGFGSKMVITGDATQIDLPDGKPSGLKEAMRVLRDVEGVGIRELTDADVVRHVMVQRIVRAYEDYEKSRQAREEVRADSPVKRKEPERSDRSEKKVRAERPDRTGEKPIRRDKPVKRDRPVKRDKNVKREKTAKRDKPVKREKKRWKKGKW